MVFFLLAFLFLWGYHIISFNLSFSLQKAKKKVNMPEEHESDRRLNDARYQ